MSHDTLTTSRGSVRCDERLGSARMPTEFSYGYHTKQQVKSLSLSLFLLSSSFGCSGIMGYSPFTLDPASEELCTPPPAFWGEGLTESNIETNENVQTQRKQ